MVRTAVCTSSSAVTARVSVSVQEWEEEHKPVDGRTARHSDSRLHVLRAGAMICAAAQDSQGPRRRVAARQSDHNHELLGTRTCERVGSGLGGHSRRLGLALGRASADAHAREAGGSEGGHSLGEK